MLGHDGKRLDPDRNDLADWRELFAQELRDQGVDAEATKREVRGVVLKPERPVVHQIKKDKRVPKVEVLQELDAIAVLTAERQVALVEAGTWVAKINAVQQRVRSGWLALAEQLKRDPVKSVFTTAGHQERLRRVQQAGAAYQVQLVARRAGEAPRSAMRFQARTADFSGI